MISIEETKKRGKYFEVTDQYGRKEKFPEIIVFQFSIFPGRNFSNSIWLEIKKKSSSHECFEHLLRFISIRPITELEAKKKLRSKAYTSEIISETLEKAKKLDLINDSEIVKNFADQQIQSSRFGKKRIFQKLQQRGINPELIRDIQEQISSEDPDDDIELRNALKAGSLKMSLLGKEKDPQKKKAKLLRFLSYRGFSTIICFKATDRLLHEHPSLFL